MMEDIELLEIDEINKAISSLQAEINDLLDSEITHFFENIPSSIQPILTYYHEQGGKRLRPAIFVILSNALRSQENLGPFALAIELIHTMSLYHDDVLDGADERRGSLTAHKHWDEATAIIGGDILHSQIHRHILHSAKIDRISTSHAVDFLASLTKIEVTIGCAVLEEMNLAKSPDLPSLELSSRINSQKTAPLFAFSAKMAAIISDEYDKSQQLYDLGWKLGEAFQLLDDVLDYFPSNKDIGGDLRERKKTPLLIKASQEDPEFVSNFISKNQYTEKDVETFRSKFSHIFTETINHIIITIKSVRNELYKMIENNNQMDILFGLLLIKCKQMLKQLE